jgi:hypothetical protein
MPDTNATRFKYESDGDKHRPTYYIIASNLAWSDDQRLDCPDAKTARRLLLDLKNERITMLQAADHVNGRWL